MFKLEIRGWFCKLRVEPTSEESLWMIVAIIHPFKLDAVTLAIEAVPDFGGVTVGECRRFGKEKVARELSRAKHEDAGLIDFTTKTRVECAVSGTRHAEVVIDAIAKAAHTGNRGDGKLFAWPITRVVRLRTLQEGVEAF